MHLLILNPLWSNGTRKPPHTLFDRFSFDKKEATHTHTTSQKKINLLGSAISHVLPYFSTKRHVLMASKDIYSFIETITHMQRHQDDILGVIYAYMNMPFVFVVFCVVFDVYILRPRYMRLGLLVHFDSIYFL